MKKILTGNGAALAVLCMVMCMTIFAPQAGANGDLCSSIFSVHRSRALPLDVTVDQYGYLPGRFQGGDNWFLGRYSASSGHWGFASRTLHFTSPHIAPVELRESYNLQLMSKNFLSFTYDTYKKRAFKNTALKPDEFLSNLAGEDQNSSESGTTFLGFKVKSEVVATVKISERSSDVSLPLENKLPLARKLIAEDTQTEHYFELGRLAKSRASTLSLESIFTFVSHNLLQKNIKSGFILGHAAKSQTSIYEKLGFEVWLSESDLGSDNFVVRIPVEKFLRLYPPQRSKVAVPFAITFFDEVYHRTRYTDF